LRPVNLIPVDQRRGAARTAGKRPTGVYLLLGGLGVAVLGVCALVMTANDVNAKTDKLAEVRNQEQRETAVADALRPYGQFAQLATARKQQIEQIAFSRYDWANSLRQISIAIPSNVWLLDVNATVSSDVEMEAGAGDVSAMRGDVPGPAIAFTGCAFSQHSVARMMSRLRNLDNVTRVRLAKSSRKDEQDAIGTAVTTAAGAEKQNDESEDCTAQGKDADRITKFSILAELGGAPQTSAGAEAGVPGAYAAQATGAQAAAAQSGAASTAAAGGGQ
jgi:Tfp pilus assembly protein PilN